MSKTKIEIQAGIEQYEMKPDDRQVRLEKKQIQMSKPVFYTCSDITDKIVRGCIISPAILEGGAGKKNWNRQQIFMIDIDNNKAEHELLPFEGIEIYCERLGLNLSFFYETFSSTKRVPKFRLGFIMENMVTDDKTREIIINGLLNLFPQADTSCKNSDRIFFGTDKGCFFLKNLDGSIRYCTIESIIEANLNKRLKKIEDKERIEMAKGYIQIDLEKFKKEFDLLSLMKSDNGEISCESEERIDFKNCCICGHHDDLRYFKNTNTWYCYSSSGDVGGDCITYYQISRNVDFKTALNDLQNGELKPINSNPNKINEIKAQKKGKNSSVKNLGIIEDKALQEKLQELEPETRYARDGIGNVDFFYDTCKDVAIFVPEKKAWFSFDTKKYWKENLKNICLINYLKTVLDNLLFYCQKLGNGKEAMEYNKYVTRLRNNNNIKNMLDLGTCKFAKNIEELDKDDYLFNCKNGTINLKTFEFKEHDTNDYITKMSNVIYNSDASSQVFEKFISEVMENDKEKIEYLQKILGYTLIGENLEEKFFILYGAKTRNGKSTLIGTFSYMLGETNGYAINIDPSTLAQKQNKDSSKASGDIARLKGTRFISCNEIPKNLSLDVALLKQITGRDKITARFLFGSEFEFVVQGTLFVNTNYLPKVNDSTLFDSNRAQVIPFNRSFSEEEQNKELKTILKEEENISGFFNWCLEGLKKYYKEGLKPPVSIVQATNEYRNISNSVIAFYNEALEKSEEKTILQAKYVYEYYKAWCEENGYTSQEKKIFFAYGRENGFIEERGTINGKRVDNVIKGYKYKNT